MAQIADEAWPDPETLLAHAAREGRGRLKIFLGAAPGVGKTWEMLAAARRRQEEGTDVLAGLIETHGQTENVTQCEGLPLLPRLGCPIAAKSLRNSISTPRWPAIRARCLLTSWRIRMRQGLRHAQRWQDVDEILAAGINVWSERR